MPSEYVTTYSVCVDGFEITQVSIPDFSHLSRYEAQQEIEKVRKTIAETYEVPVYYLKFKSIKV